MVPSFHLETQPMTQSLSLFGIIAVVVHGEPRGATSALECEGSGFDPRDRCSFFFINLS